MIPFTKGALTRGRLLGGSFALIVVGTFVAANAHLVTVSITSQPDCVAHQKTAGEGGFRAALSSC